MKQISWDDIEEVEPDEWDLAMMKEIGEVEPDEEEARILDAYEAGDPDYQPYITHEQLMAELGL